MCPSHHSYHTKCHRASEQRSLRIVSKVLYLSRLFYRICKAPSFRYDKLDKLLTNKLTSMKKRTVIFYRSASGTCPVEDFLDSQPGKIAKKIVWVLRLVEELEFVPARYFAKLPGTDEIWECRINLASNAYRFLCFLSGKSSVVLTHGFIKKTKKTPRNEIRRAEACKRDNLERKDRHEQP
jgi:phage-related protein